MFFQYNPLDYTGIMTVTIAGWLPESIRRSGSLMAFDERDTLI
jgi:hypothetical protein